MVDRGDVGRRLYIKFTEHNPAHCTESMSIKFKSTTPSLTEAVIVLTRK